MGAPPPISIRCECGEARAVPYGETWTCEECGRRWDTRQIPAEEYFGRLRRMRRFRVELLGLVAIGLAVFVPLVLLVNSALILVAGMISLFFFIWYMPFWRRRVRRAATDAPTWELHPE
jgi:hypothetical protein